MGYGDDLLITKFASQIKKKFPERQIVVGNLAKKQVFHSIIYDNNPNISDCRNLDLKKPIHIIDYHPGNRPYIDYKKSTNTHYIWNKKFKPTPGEIYFSKKEEIKAEAVINEAKIFWNKINKKQFKKIIFLETSSTKIDDKQFNIKHLNKDWGYDNWKNLIDIIKNDYLIIHSIHEKTRSINGVFAPKNIDFRLACSIINKSDIYVGPEGGFGHVAAALNKKAVLYFGGWISPKVIGYDFHENLYFENEKSPCGQYKNICNHCIEARKKITAEIFKDRIIKSLSN
tara:strand:- start:1296 stop:2150 length:855 start_codon:yes stop_codon:yes gene_type:complete